MKLEQVYINVIQTLKKLETQIGLKFFKIEEFDSLSTPYRAMQVFAEIDGVVITGIGVDQNPKLALIKATSEFFERWICLENAYENSNGFAAHGDQKAARDNAFHEIIERDAYFFHHFHGIAFEKINNLIDEKDLEQIKQTIKSHGLEFNFYKMLNYDNSNSILCVLEGENASQCNGFGALLGMAYDTNIERSKLKSLLECYRLYITHVFVSQLSSISLNEFNQLDHPQMFDHTKLGLNLEYFNEYKEMFLASSNTIDQKRDLRVGVNYQEFDIKNKLSATHKLVVSHATSKDLINIHSYSNGEVELPFEALHRKPYLLS